MTFFIDMNSISNELKKFTNLFMNIGLDLNKKFNIPKNQCEKNLWIIKPVNLNQGRGIELFDNLL